MRNTYKNQSFLLLAHYATFAFQDLLFDFLTNHKVPLVTKFNLPMPELPYLTHIEITLFRNGHIEKSVSIPSFYRIPIAAHFLQAIQLLFITLFSLPKHDVIIAHDSLLSTIALILRLLGKCKSVIFYSHGRDATRFKNSLLQYMYSQLDTFAATNCNYNWILAPTMLPIRRKQNIPDGKIYVVPASIPIKLLTRKNRVNNNRIVFLGVLSYRNGVELLPKIMVRVRQIIPDATLDIIGNGELYDVLLQEIKQKKLQKVIRLLGLQKLKQYASSLTKYRIGIAPYINSLENLTSLTDPMKLRIYLAAGLPVVVTKGFHFSLEIEKFNVGITTSCNTDSIAHAIIHLIRDKKLYGTMRTNALAYSIKYDMNAIYKKTFRKMFRIDNES